MYRRLFQIEIYIPTCIKSYPSDPHLHSRVTLWILCCTCLERERGKSDKGGHGVPGAARARELSPEVLMAATKAQGKDTM